MNPETTWPSAPGAESIHPPLSTRELQAFAGEALSVGAARRPDYYVPRWVAMLSSGSERGGFNWAAALCGANWCFWRKLYGLAFAVLVAEFVTSLLIAMIVSQATGAQPEPGTLGAASWAALVPVRGLLGMHANGLYLGRAIQTIAAARRLGADERAQGEFIAASGGTSWVVLGVALGLQLLVMLMPMASA